VFDILNTRDWWGLVEAYPNHIKALYEMGQYDEAMWFANNWQERTVRRDNESEKDAIKAFAKTWLEHVSKQGDKREIQLVKSWIDRLEKI
jgi:hypothetical protein